MAEEVQYTRGRNPRSLANLGKPRTKAKPKTFKLTQSAIDWLETQPNQTAAIENLIQRAIQEKDG